MLLDYLSFIIESKIYVTLHSTAFRSCFIYNIIISCNCTIDKTEPSTDVFIYLL